MQIQQKDIDNIFRIYSIINEKYNNDEIKSYLIRKAQLDVINRIKLKELGNKNFHIDIDINSLN